MPAPAAVRADQIRTLFDQNGPVLLANLLNAAVVTATLWTMAAQTLLLAWFGALLVMTLVRLDLRRRYRRARPGRDEIDAWGRRLLAGTLVAGALWGAGGAVFFNPDSPIAEILITFAVGGMTAAAAGTLSPFLPAFFAFMVPALTPLFVRVALVGDALHCAMAGMILVFAGGMTVVARNTNRAVSEVFRLRYENEALLDRLAAAQLNLQQTNRTLEDKVSERTAALEKQGEALRSAQRLEAVGRLAGGVAHDFNNLLTVVLGNASLLLDSDDLTESDRLAVGEMRDAADRGADLVRQLLAFGGRQRLESALLDLNQVLMDLRPLLARLITERVTLQVEPAAGVLPVVVDRSQIEQVVVNLATNARDAMPHGGKLIIRTRRADPDFAAFDAAGRRTPITSPHGFAVLEVVDEGQGMDTETRRRAFEPFFTTKSLGRGTGLGLATVYGIIEQSGGRIDVISAPGAGSRFVVQLPLGVGIIDKPASATAPAAQPLRARTILLAEDDDEVRSVTERLLTGMGHRVLVAPNGERALELARSHRGAIDVLVTDVVMGAIGGGALAATLRAERPNLRVLFISGYSPAHHAPEKAVGDDTQFLQKPFAATALRQKLDVLLANAEPALRVAKA